MEKISKEEIDGFFLFYRFPDVLGRDPKYLLGLLQFLTTVFSDVVPVSANAVHNCFPVSLRIWFLCKFLI